ncbi:MAG TPA: glycosyltransferase family 2 protein [Anaerolineaceae bacterium]|nr:glycosyltransferase family 2 protein [Anaerolineaceae bacterium]
MKLVITIPALNEEETILNTLEKIPGSFLGIDEITILVVDDGSTDNTANLAAKAGANVVSHIQNKGVGSAFQTAVSFALEHNADLLVNIDADGQFDPNEIPLLITPVLDRKADMVIGNRFHSGMPVDMPRVKFRGNKMVSRLVSAICGQSFTDVSCGFRSYNRESLYRLNIYGQFTYTHETILSAVYQGLKVIEVPISVRYYPERRSRVAGSIPKYAIQTSKIIMRVLLDYRPLKVFGTTSIISIVIGLAFGIFLFIHYILTRSFTPYKTFGFLALGFIIFGLIILFIALVSDMLNRMKRNQEKMLFELKKLRHERKNPKTSK